MTLDASRLEITVDEEAGWKRRLNVTVPADFVREEEQKAARNLASRANLKGFRKGRVPARMIEGRFKGALRQEALDKLVGDAYREALAARELRPISEGEIENVRYEPESDLHFSVTFDVEPVVDLETLGGFVVERPVPTVTDEQVDEVLDRIREEAGVWKPAEEGLPNDKDTVSVHIVRLTEEGEETAEGRDYEIRLGQGDAIPDIENAIRTLEPGAAGDFDVAFPEDFPDDARRGQSERVRITLTSRKEMEVPELDDDLARQVGEFETLDELRAKVREDLERDAEQQADSVVRGRLLDALLEANPVEIPTSMIDRYSDSMIGEHQEELGEEKLAEVRERLRPEAERVVKRIMVIERIAETQGLKASDDELDARVEEIATANDTEPAKVYAQLQKSGRLEALERELTERKVFDFLKAQSEIIEESES
ncbi:MAG: trigger factor [Gemmatimonadota bacterium]|nr:trigger factor [Gemmatimonadota bacterium]